MTNHEPQPVPDQPTPTSYRKWWLIGIPVLLVGGIAGVIIYKNQGQLTQAKLDAARSKWEAARIQNYDLEVTVSGNTQGYYQLQVRGGKPVTASLNNKPFEPKQFDRAEAWTIPALFEILQSDIERDALPGSQRVYTQVEFDPHDGHLVRYIRKQLAGGQAITIEVQLRVVSK